MMRKSSSPTLDVKNHRGDRTSLTTVLAIAVWFGIATGLVEGAGLLLFQRLDWARWGPMVHVSEPILWVSPLVDVTFFVLLGLIAALIARIVPRLPMLRILVLVLSALSIFDWLTLTGRFYQWSSRLLALGAAFAFSRWFAQRELRVATFWRKTAPWAVAIGAIAFVSVEGGSRFFESLEVASLPVASPDAPNVLILVVDTLRADHLSSYGYSRPTSLSIDRIAKEGVLFQNAVATCSWSFPSHVSLVTGRYQFEHGMGAVPPMPIFGTAVPSFHGYPTLGQVLEQRGYRTAGFSANRTYFSRDLGFWQGMAHFEDYFHSPADAFLRTLYGREFSRIYLSGTDSSKPRRLLRWLGVDSILDSDEEQTGVRKRATVVNRELLDWVDRGPSSRPFFALLNYFDVHAPYDGPRSFSKPPWSQKNSVDLYDNSIRYVDDSIGQLMMELAKRGLSEKTLVIVTSDHGESLGQHGLETHGTTLYRELIRVPLVLRYPGHIPGRKSLTENVSNSAIPATVMDLLGDGTRDFPGRSLVEFWRNARTQSTPSTALSELAENHFLPKREREAARRVPAAISGPMQSLVFESWHLIVHQSLGVQLYDWTQDPGESKNLIDTPTGRATEQQLSEKMHNLMARPREVRSATASSGQ
jgi:arylsulfatase A-like enzyme